MRTDTRHMRRALELARRAEGLVSPRPPVGAVVVASDGSVAGEGWTQATPGPHAEVAALDAAGARGRGSTLYVTLEPCCHVGATGPCTEAIVAAGVRRVVAAVRDPFPSVRGRGFAALRRAGVDVDTGTLVRPARELIAPFAVWAAFGRPLVTLKLAASLDGKVAAPDGTSRWISGPRAREEVHRLRARVDAIMVGAGTVAADDPALTVRLPGLEGRTPLRVVVDSSGRTPPTARVLDGSVPTTVITTPDVPAERRAAWGDVIVVPRGDGGVSLPDGLRALGGRGVCHVLAEGGPALAGALVAEGLADRFVLYLAPIVIGGDAPGLFSEGVKTLADAWRLHVRRVEQVGEDLRVESRFG